MPQNTLEEIRIRQAIKEYRIKNRISLKQFGALLDISPQAVHKWEQGVNYPDITMIPRIAALLGVSVSYLFGEDGTTLPNWK